MKKAIATILTLLLFICPFSTVSAKSEPKPADIKVFVNDQLQAFPLYEADDSYRKEYYAPLKTLLEKTGAKVRTIGTDKIEITCDSGREATITLLENNLASHTSPRVSTPYIVVDGEVYLLLGEFPRFSDLSIYSEKQGILIFSKDYYEANHVIYADIGHKTSLDAYINDVKIDSPVYENTSMNHRFHYLSQYRFDDFVLLQPAFEAIGAKVTFRQPDQFIIESDELGRIEISADAIVDTASDDIKVHDGACYIVDGIAYIRFPHLRIITDGSLTSDKNSISVYTSNYERADIPDTLEEAYAFLSKILDGEDIEYIKNANDSEMAGMYFGLGRWIRNQWLYPTTNSKTRISKIFADQGVRHPDDMSGYIIWGYREYLNGRPSDITSIVPCVP